MTATAYRDASDADVAFLSKMIFVAWRWDRSWDQTAFEEHRDTQQGDPWVDGFGEQRTDLGVVAEHDGVPVGAAWCRLLPQVVGPGHVSDAIPQVAVGVEERWRGHGIGSLLLGQLIQRARAAQLPGLSLHVATGNATATRLYERLEFRRHDGLDSGTVMLLPL